MSQRPLPRRKRPGRAGIRIRGYHARDKTVKIALIGSRGIPARYSGFEQFYEQLAIRLVERGHRVTVYNRSHFIKDVKKTYKGIRIVSLPSIPTKHLDTIIHTFFSTLHALTQRYDIVYYCIAGNSPLVWLPRLVRAKTLINVDGEDWAREKWSGFASKYQKWCEKVACKCSNVVVADARGVLERYRRLYNHEAIFVPYGANIQTDLRDNPKSLPSKWNLSPDSYILYVGRFVPENAIDLLIRAFKRLTTEKRLVLVGDAPYAEAYKRSLHELASGDKRIVFTGYAFGEDYAQLSANAYFYVQPAGIDGTRPALLDQMGFGNCVLARNSAVNMEVIDNYGCSFDRERPEESLPEVMQNLIDHPELVAKYKQNAASRIEHYYNWEWVTSFYEDLFDTIRRKERPIHYDAFIKNNPAITENGHST